MMEGSDVLIHKGQFEAMCRINCTIEEVCAVLQVCHSTLNKWCKQEYNLTAGKAMARFRGEGRMSLRRAMWRKAIEDDDGQMQKWLSKQELGMSDKMDNTHRQEYTREQLRELVPQALRVLEIDARQLLEGEIEEVDDDEPMD